MKLFFICLFLFLTPSFSHAEVRINEIAWMGTSVSANDEWIELYNDSTQDVLVDGWRLSDGASFDIALLGILSAGKYAVLERTDDASAPGAAFITYSGSLVNTGATLSLYRADNSLEYRVVGGEDWGSAGGDNVTKETAQYTTGGWLTAAPTPGTQNTQENIPPEDEVVVDTSDEGGLKTETSSSVSTLYTTQREVYLTMEVPKRVYVHQEVSMYANATGPSSGIVNSLVHTWNFGDFTTGIGEETTHRFEYPGEYVVTLYSQYKEYEAFTRQTIVVLPVSFSMTMSPSGDVQIHNNAQYEVDVSGYKIAAGKTLRFPEGTILLPNATITIPKEKLQYTNNATLFDDTAVQVATVVKVPIPERAPVVFEEIPQRVQPVVYAPLLDPVSLPIEDFTFAADREVSSSVATQTPQVIGAGQMAAPIEAAGDFPERKLPYFALLAVIGLGVTAVFAGKISK